MNKSFNTAAHSHEFTETLLNRWPAEGNTMHITAIIQSIQDETNEQLELPGRHRIANRILELNGMLEIFKLMDQKIPAILYGAVLVMHDKLSEKYKEECPYFQY